MKYYLLLLSFLPVFVWGQQASKLNIGLFIEMNRIAEQDRKNVLVPALVKGDLGSIETIIKEAGETYKYGVKNIASVYISLATVELLLANPAVQRIEYRKAIGQNLAYSQDSIMFNNNNVWDAHSGGGVLPYGFKGKGVLLGVIDDGFEWRHPDFIDSSNQTRIMHLWDQSSNDLSFFEANYGYGASWDSTDLNAYQCSHAVGGHGSHVMGTAGGNGRAANKYMGVAPEADLGCVKVVGGANFLTGFVDGLNFLFEKADAKGQACPVNSSVGAYSSGHDGKDLYAQLVDNMLTAKSGRALIQAAGNARRDDFHLGVNLNNSTSKTWFKFHNALNRTHLILYADTADFSNVNFSLQLMNPSNYQIIAQTGIFNVLQNFTFSGSVASFSQVLFMDVNNNPVTLDIYIDQYEDAYELYISISSMNDLGDWQLTTSGSGKFDVWGGGNIGTSEMAMNIPVANYKSPDNTQSIVGYWTCSDKVITVSSYQNRDQMVKWGGDTINISYPGYPQFGISHFSSLGPTRTGLSKPDITAPGGQVLSAAPLGTLNTYKTSGDNRLDVAGWHVSNRGTSMAAPMVAGAAALYFQCKPYASTLDLKQAIEASARLDQHVFAQTLALPNIHWGYGKLDVYKLLESCLIYGCLDSSAMNYNPFATVSDSSCFYIPTGISNLKNQTSLTCQPNPFQGLTTISYDLSQSEGIEGASISVYNALGQQVFQKILSQHSGMIEFSGAHLANGAYWVVLENNGKKQAHQQLVLRGF